MSKSYREITREVSASIAKLRADLPDTTKGFSMMARSALHDGALDKKTKELIALALGVAVYMGGGPSLMYAADALSAYEEMSAG